MSKTDDSEMLCRRVAHIMGESSGAAQAIKCLEAKRAEGMDAWVWNEGNKWLVFFEPPVGSEQQ